MNRERGFSTDAGAAIRTTVRQCSAISGCSRVCPSQSTVTCSCREPRLSGGRQPAAKEGGGVTLRGAGIAVSLFLFRLRRYPCSSCETRHTGVTSPKWEQQLLAAERELLRRGDRLSTPFELTKDESLRFAIFKRGGGRLNSRENANPTQKRDHVLPNVKIPRILTARPAPRAFSAHLRSENNRNDNNEKRYPTETHVLCVYI